MEFYNRKDLEYWRRQAEIGRAVIIEIPEEMLLNLDIEALSSSHHSKISPEELTQWIEENREAFAVEAEKEKGHIAEAEKLEQELYGSVNGDAPEHKPDRQVGHTPNMGIAPETASDNTACLSMPAGLNAEQKAAWTMEHTEFTEEQIGVIVEAMSQDLPPKYLLCFMKKEYSPVVMRQLKEYCLKMYRQEQTGDSHYSGSA